MPRDKGCITCIVISVDGLATIAIIFATVHEGGVQVRFGGCDMRTWMRCGLVFFDRNVSMFDSYM